MTWPDLKAQEIKVPVSKPDLSIRDMLAVMTALMKSEISGGSQTIRKAEAAFERYLGKDTLLTSNGSVAIILALRALGIGPQDEVLVPNLTYAATASSVVNVGATPVFCDVSDMDWNISLDSMRQNLSSKTRAIILVDLYGLTRDWSAEIAWARAHGLRVIIDRAESFGVELPPLGADVSAADVETYSFFANKILVAGEGGLVCSRDPEIISKMDLLRGQGMSKTERYSFLEAGYNFRISGLQAALVESQLRRIDQMLTRRRSIIDFYDLRLGDLVSRPDDARGNLYAPWLYSAILKLESALKPIDVAKKLAESGIETRPFFRPLDSEPAFSKYKRLENPYSHMVSSRGISLPTSSTMSQADLHFVVRSFRSVYER